MVTSSSSRGVNVVFCVDSTGSMDWLMESVQLGIEKVAQIYLASRFEIRVGLVEFRDRVYARGKGDVEYDPIGGGVHPTMRLKEFNSGSFTSNISDFTDAVRSIEPAGGGDEPESSFDAIATSATIPDWGEESSKRVIIHMTDAPPVIPDDNIKSCSQLAGIITDSGIDQIFIIAPEETHEHYFPLQNATDRNGDYIMVSYHQITSDVDRTVDLLQLVAKTSSDSFGEEDASTGAFDSFSENPFADDDEDDDDDGSDNPFADDDEGDEEDIELSDGDAIDIGDGDDDDGDDDDFPFT